MDEFKHGLGNGEALRKRVQGCGALGNADPFSLFPFLLFALNEQEEPEKWIQGS